MPEPVAVHLLGLEAGSELAELVRRWPEMEVLRFRDGELLLREGDRGRDLLLVARGALVVERAGPPPTVLANLMADADAPVVLGEMAYFGEAPRSASVRCVGAATALRLQPAQVDGILDTFPGLTRLICRQFAERLREANSALAGFRRSQDLAATSRNLEDGEPLFQAGAPADHLYQLVLGRLDLEGPEGRRRVAAEDLPGGFVELAPWLRRSAHRCSARAAGSALVAAVAGDRRAAFLRRYPELALDAWAAP